MHTITVANAVPFAAASGIESLQTRALLLLAFIVALFVVAWAAVFVAKRVQKKKAASELATGSDVSQGDDWWENQVRHG